MPTTVHIPDRLLTALDQRAEALGVSRNRLIVQAVEQSLCNQTEWPAGFFERFSNVDPEVADAVDEMLQHIIANRRSKPPLSF